MQLSRRGPVVWASRSILLVKWMVGSSIGPYHMISVTSIKCIPVSHLGSPGSLPVSISFNDNTDLQYVFWVYGILEVPH